MVADGPVLNISSIFVPPQLTCITGFFSFSCKRHQTALVSLEGVGRLFWFVYVTHWHSETLSKAKVSPQQPWSLHICHSNHQSGYVRLTKCLVKERFKKTLYVFIQHGGALQVLTMGDLCCLWEQVRYRAEGGWCAGLISQSGSHEKRKGVFSQRNCVDKLK